MKYTAKLSKHWLQYMDKSTGPSTYCKHTSCLAMDTYAMKLHTIFVLMLLSDYFWNSVVAESAVLVTFMHYTP